MTGFKDIYWPNTSWFPFVWLRGQVRQVMTISDVAGQLAVLKLP